MHTSQLGRQDFLFVIHNFSEELRVDCQGLGVVLD